jgi:RNA 2',3'-cyclic 3'-phosphodiesterase
VKEELGRAIAALEGSVPSARWVPVQNIHVTLAFLGRVDEERIGPLAAAIADAVQDHVDFTVRLGELGAFPSVRRARVIWAGLDDPSRGLAGLADSVAEAAEPLGFRREARAFQSHATIARLKVPAPVELAVTPAPLTFAVERISLFESHLQRPAPVYEELATFPFRRGS